MNPLSEIPKHCKVKIEKIIGDLGNQERLHELGFIPGSITSMIAKLPFNGPLAFKIHGTKLALRKEDADCILVSSL